MGTLPLFVGLAALAGLFASHSTAGTGDHVVLLHGLGRGPLAMKVLEHRLEAAGYRVHNLGYPRRADTLDEMVAAVERQLEGIPRAPGSRLHFVTHSLGGLVVRGVLADGCPEDVGRVVMLAPPNGGSEIVDALARFELFGAAFGPLARQLGTGASDLPARLPPPACETGILAGNRWLNPAGPLLLPGPHDGTVSVASTRLAGMRDHRVVPHTHTFIVNSRAVADDVIHFLEHGRFAEAPDST